MQLAASVMGANDADDRVFGVMMFGYHYSNFTSSNTLKDFFRVPYIYFMTFEIRRVTFTYSIINSHPTI